LDRAGTENRLFETYPVFKKRKGKAMSVKDLLKERGRCSKTMEIPDDSKVKIILELKDHDGQLIYDTDGATAKSILQNRIPQIDTELEEKFIDEL